MKICLVLAALVFLPASASAVYLDAIQVKLNDGCSLAEYTAIKNDFNSQWGEKNGYLAEIASPIQNPDLTHVFWLGRTANAASYGRAWDTWRDALADPKSVPGKLNARFQKCTTNVSRTGWDIL